MQSASLSLFSLSTHLILNCFLVAVLGSNVSGCVSTIALDWAVVAYDKTTAEIMSKQLLLNIARARYNQPPHFTGISNIAATYNFSFTTGATPALTGERGSLLVPFFGGSVAENPTISIAPMQGEEFTQRLLTPFPEQKLTMLLRQGYDIDALLRLLAGELRLPLEGYQEVVFYNDPSDRDGYPVFRRVMAHLSSVQDRHALLIEPLQFQYRWTLPASAVTPEGFQSTYKDFALAYDAEKQVYRVSKQVTGRIIITNYTLALLPLEERLRLQEEADAGPSNEILVDIRSGYPGGEYPVRGKLRLRSFYNVLTFIGHTIVEEPEYDVPPDPRTPPISENPVHALDILETDRAPSGVGPSVALNGHYYAVRPEAGYQWNRKAFSLLYQLFQMTVSAVPQAGPAITISK